MNNNLNLPDLIELNDFGGDFAEFEESVYQVFRNDFVTTKPIFEGIRLALKRYPIRNGKEATYYHITHEGNNEENREPSLRRMERIGFPKPIINNSGDDPLRVWKKIAKNKNRILIFHEEESYLVVLEDRGTYILFWTAYYIEFPNKVRRLIKEYESYKNAETA